MSKRSMIALAVLAIGCIGVLSCRSVGNTPLPANPNRDRIAFLKHTDPSIISLLLRGANTSIEVMNTGSFELTHVMQHHDLQWTLDWSPDGDYIAYFDNNTQSLYKIVVDGSGQPELLLQKAYGIHPSWSPDGSQIAYAGSGDIHLLHLASKQITSLLGETTKGTHPDWSPDGGQVVFTQNPVNMEGPPSSIAAINMDGSGLVQLTPDDGSNSPKWSPDGSKIVFQKAGNIYVMNSDGSNVHALIEDGKSYMPAWSSDGTEIVFLSDINQKCGVSIAGGPRFCTNEIRIMNSDGSNIEVLRNEPNERYMTPVWAP